MKATALKRGATVWWCKRDHAGEVCLRRQVTLAADPFDIERSDGTPSTVVALTCHRLAAVRDLFEHESDVPPMPKKSRAASRGGRGRGDRKATDRTTADPLPMVAAPKSAPSSATTAAPTKRPAEPATPAAEIEPVEILAIDFMNLLVRAWHAGKPTETHAVRSMFQTVAGAIRKLNPAKVVFCMDGGHAHRSKILPSYKAHRPPSDPGLVAQRELATEAIAAAGFCSVRVEGYEADDVLASIAKACDGVVIASSDKDLFALAGFARIFKPWSGGEFVRCEDVLGIPPGQVVDYLALCGDSSDGVPGVKGIGPKTAVSLLEDFGSLEAVLSAAGTGQVKGAAGKKLKAGIADALMSQQLVELVDRLPLPQLHPWNPPRAFQAKLQAMGLGNVASILDGLLQTNPPPPQAESEPEPEPEPEPAATLAASATEAASSDFTAEDAYTGGVKCRERADVSGEPAENPWKAGTKWNQLWQAGYYGLPMPDVDAMRPPPAVSKSSPPPADVPVGNAVSNQGNLF
ncbi:MAG: hypothetical protein Fues2KO_14280 [Fuerstiella sp.]